MLEPIYTKVFRRQYRLMMKRGVNLDKLMEVMDTLECHIQGDWVLIYEIDPVAHTVTFHRTGTHSDLF